MTEPPTTIYFSETGGKSSPLYFALRGIRSAAKTTWRARWDPEYVPPPVYRGQVTWIEIDLETGEVKDPGSGP